MTAPRPTVLIADNDESVAAVLRLFLEREGLEVEVAGDGLRARERVLARRFDVLVCDLDMPLLAGERLIEALGTSAPPTVVASGYIDTLVEKRLRCCPSVRDVLRKPFDLMRFARLVAAIARGDGAAEGGGDPP
ncbi:MAG: response regulator [Planctomycetes bacterium]|nr:response regulator [Planctomycetota bacterium]